MGIGTTPNSDPQGRSVERRRREILEATCGILQEKGFAAIRISDVAQRLGISTGLVHYHFDTKEELLAAAFRHAAQAELDALRLVAERGTGPRERWDAVVSEFFPRGDDPSWRLWIEGWGEALRSEAFQATSRELDKAWIGVLSDTIADGVRSGEFECTSPRDAAWRLACLIEGLAIQRVAHGGTGSDREMRRLVGVALAAEVSGGLR